MWQRIPAVAAGLTAQGGLELVLGVGLLIGGLDSDARAAEGLYERFLDSAGPGLLLLCGGLKAAAGARNRAFRSRTLGLIALWSGLGSAAVWMCAPSALALCAWGVIVYRHPASRQAFTLGSSGRSAAEVAAALEEPS